MSYSNLEPEFSHILFMFIKYAPKQAKWNKLPKRSKSLWAVILGKFYPYPSL